MARRIINRMDKRAEYEAYERRQEEEEGDEEDEGEEEEGEPEEAEEEEIVDEEEEEEEEEAVPKKRKAAKEPKAKPKPKSRSRAPKAAPRMKVVWGVFNNSNQRVATFDYPKRREADEHAAKLRADKNQTFFVQPIKEPIEEKEKKQ